MVETKFGMRVFACLLLCGIVQCSYAQFRKRQSQSDFGKEASLDYPAKFYVGQSHVRKLSSPLMTQSLPSGSDRTGTNYWTNNVTSQSYGQGKVGTFYYWDVQGNLREMKGFVDIAGKNKRGLKLVFPWR